MPSPRLHRAISRGRAPFGVRQVLAVAGRGDRCPSPTSPYPRRTSTSTRRPSVTPTSRWFDGHAMITSARLALTRSRSSRRRERFGDARRSRARCAPPSCALRLAGPPPNVIESSGFIVRSASSSSSPRRSRLASIPAPSSRGRTTLNGRHVVPSGAAMRPARPRSARRRIGAAPPRRARCSSLRATSSA